MPADDFDTKLAAFCADRFGEGELSGLRQLSGGANMESWAFDYDGREMVLRKLPNDMEERDVEAGSIAAISLDTQAELIELARQRGVTAPEVLAVLRPGDALSKGFVMVRAKGETLPHKILGKPEFAQAEKRLTAQCARELATIHAIDPVDLPEEVQQVTPQMLLTEQEKAYREIGGSIPIYDFAFRWLEGHMPEPVEPRLLHADFRMGNLMIDREGITAVLDWELAHLGDPMEDLSYLCTPSWRFGHYEEVAGGFDSAENLITAYEEASGTAVEQERFNWWLTYNTLWWGVACLRMGHSYRDGTAHTLERTIIGRRASEVEIDLLLQFEPIRDADNGSLDWSEPPLLPTHGEVEYSEILAALREWAKEKVLPNAEGHALFEARVANNALGIAQRHAAWGENFATAARNRCAAIGSTHEALCNALRTAERDLGDDALWDHLRMTALERLSIDQPKYGGLRVAKDKWGVK